MKDQTDTLIDKYNLRGRGWGFYYGYKRCAFWLDKHAQAAVVLIPPEPGVYWADTQEEAILAALADGVR